MRYTSVMVLIAAVAALIIPRLLMLRTASGKPVKDSDRAAPWCCA
jgi:hypothetical protein